MPSIRCRNFLWCLSLRSGVCILAVLGFMLGALGAAMGWAKVSLMLGQSLSVKDEAILFILPSTFSLLVVISLLGVIGGIARIRSLIFSYPKLLAVHFLLLIISFALSLYSAIHSSDLSETQCDAESLSKFMTDFCKPGWSTVNVLSVILFAVALLVQIYNFIIAINFAEDLDYDDAASTKDITFPDAKSKNSTFDLSTTSYDEFLKMKV
ncbi:hypothetical protein D9758_000687 [Tetrapyrgos nigripes]|uniref:Tetraspanin n=1 Tax=Tetrapyrgos nigripes TaxID=182062 RepID=A0A8H5LY47_9AGAR|nr:hypothetical protein D9758_000687 [Tetrapyrgos nigripes]